MKEERTKTASVVEAPKRGFGAPSSTCHIAEGSVAIWLLWKEEVR